MVKIDVLLTGIPIWSDKGPLGYSSVALVDDRTLIDTGPVSRRTHLVEVLDGMDVPASDISDIVLTHLHWDHCENVELFPEATLHVNASQLDDFRRGDPAPRTLPGLEAVLDHHAVETFETGEVTNGLGAVPTPGHTPNHVSFELVDDPTFLFAGDAIKSAAQYRRDAAEPDRLEWLGDDVEFVVPGHDTPFYIDGGEIVPTEAASVTFDVEVAYGSPMNVTLDADHADERPAPGNVTMRDVSANGSE